MPDLAMNVGFQGETGSNGDDAKLSRLTQCMVRSCVARGFRRAGIQRSCINVSGLCLELFCSGPSWISARVRSHCRTDLNGPVGSPVFACAGKTDPPSLRILSQTSAGNGRVWDYVIACPFNAFGDQAD